MNIKSWMTRVCVGALLLSGVAACESTNKPTTTSTAQDYWYTYPRDNGDGSARPATTRPQGDATNEMPNTPAPRREAAAPAPAPAPARTGSAVMYLPTGERSTSAVMIERTSPGEVVAGSNFTYDIIVTNLTDMALNSVLVTDQPSGNFRFVSADPAPKTSGNILSWELGNLSGRQSKTIRVTGNAPASGTITHCAEVAYNNALCQTINVVQPALRIVKSITPADILVCDTATVKIDVTNTGSGAARNVKVRDPLPAGMTTADGKTNVEFDAGNLASNQTRSFTFPVKVTKTGSYVNKAMAMADGNLSAESAPVNLKVTQPVLEAKAECPAGLLIGRPATVKFTVSNTGDAVAKATTFRAPIPSGTTFVSADNGGAMTAGNVAWNLGDMAPGASKTVSVQLRTAGAGQVAVSGTASAVCADGRSVTCNFGVTGSPDLGTLLTDDEGVVLVGDNQVYRYEVENQGQVDLTNVTVVITLPAGMSFVSSTAPKAPATAGNKLTFTGVTGILKPGERRAFTLTLKSAEAGERLVVSETTCDQLKTPVRDDELTFFVDR